MLYLYPSNIHYQLLVTLVELTLPDPLDVPLPLPLEVVMLPELGISSPRLRCPLFGRRFDPCSLPGDPLNEVLDIDDGAGGRRYRGWCCMRGGGLALDL